MEVEEGYRIRVEGEEGYRIRVEGEEGYRIRVEERKDIGLGWSRGRV